MNVIIIGDIILDINYLSTITRNAPEANHIPVHNIHYVEYILGGAANVAYNLSRLGINVELISCSGKSEYHHNFKKITNILNEKNVKFKLFIDRNKKYITTKNRIIHNNNICARYDVEDDSEKYRGSHKGGRGRGRGHMSHIQGHMSHIQGHMSHIQGHMSHIQGHMSQRRTRSHVTKADAVTCHKGGRGHMSQRRSRSHVTHTGSHVTHYYEKYRFHIYIISFYIILSFSPFM